MRKVYRLLELKESGKLDPAHPFTDWTQEESSEIKHEYRFVRYGSNFVAYADRIAAAFPVETAEVDDESSEDRAAILEER
jgi:hypothetical protein